LTEIISTLFLFLQNIFDHTRSDYVRIPRKAIIVGSDDPTQPKALEISADKTPDNAMDTSGMSRAATLWSKDANSSGKFLNEIH
jgi:hypothetical protein